MSALNIYITDELKDRMNKVQANWSEICRSAIEAELLRHEGKSSPNRRELVEDSNWVSTTLDPKSTHGSAVIRPYLHQDSIRNEVKVLSDFYSSFESELKDLRLNSLKAHLRLLLEGRHHAELLFPGHDWQAGNLGIELHLYFKHPAQEDDIVEAELLSDEQEISGPSGKSPATTSSINAVRDISRIESEEGIPIPLTGNELLKKIDQLSSHLSRQELAKQCGYIRETETGKQRVDMTGFYDALLIAKGMKLDPVSIHEERESKAMYKTKVQQNGQLIIGPVQTQQLGALPGDELEIELSQQNIRLTMTKPLPNQKVKAGHTNILSSQSLSVVSPSNNNQLDRFIDIDPGIHDKETADDFKIDSLPSEVYSSFRKAWNQVYRDLGGAIKPPPSSIIKSMWKRWYHPEVEFELSEGGIEQWGSEWDSNRISWCPRNEQEELVEAFYQEYLCGYCGGQAWIYLAFVQFVSKFLFDGQLLEFDRIDPAKLDSVSLSERDELPAVSGIYFVLDETDKVKYVGMSVNLRSRWFDHHRQNDFDRLTNAKISYLPDLPKHYLREIESSLIKYLDPDLNIRGKLPG